MGAAHSSVPQLLLASRCCPGSRRAACACSPKSQHMHRVCGTQFAPRDSKQAAILCSLNQEGSHPYAHLSVPDFQVNPTQMRPQNRWTAVLYAHAARSLRGSRRRGVPWNGRQKRSHNSQRVLILHLALKLSISIGGRVCPEEFFN